MGMKRNGKSLLAKTVALSMVVGSMAPMSAMAASNDIGGHWAESTITAWQNKGMIGGYEDGTFKPDKAITRAEFVRLINQALGFSEAGNVNFSDVSSADWYFNDVAIAMGKKYCSGFPDGTFQPNAVVTRGQAASFIANAKNLTANAQAADSMADGGSMADWAKGSIGAVIGAGYMSGYPDGSFQADKVFTRAEAVSTLDRVINGASATPGQNEPDREDTSSEVTDTKGATAPDGYSGHSTGRKGSSSSGGGGGGSSSTSDKVEITSANASDYTGKTIRGKAKIYMGSSDLTLDNVRFTEAVEVLSDSSVVRAADTTRPTYKLILKGNTSATDNFTINTPVTIVADSASNTLSKLIVKAKTALAGKLFVNNIQASATTIMGDESSATTIEAEAPVNTEAGSTVATINVVAGSEATLDLKGEIATIETKGTGEIKEISIGGSASPAMNINKDIDIKVITVSEQAKPKIAVQEEAKITNLNTTGDSKPEVTVSNNAKVENVEASGSSAPKVDLKEGSSVGNIVHDSTEKIDVAGSGSITGNITATDPSKVNIGSNVGGNTDVVEVTVQSIAVKSQPKKLSYNVKDDNVLDLTGLEITVTYSDGTTKDFALADFGDKITTTPKNGTTLTAANNGKPVTISMDGKTTTTSNLTVSGGSSETTTKVVVTPASLALKVDATETLKAEVTPKPEGKVTYAWESSDEKVATVDSDGKVKAIAEGNATITVTATTADGTEYTGTCTVKVSAKDIVVNDLALGGKFAAPVKGATAATTITADQYTGTIAWATDPASDSALDGGKFKPKTKYVATVTLTANEGYTLTGIGEDAFTYAGAKATNAANSGVVTVTFDATAEEGADTVINDLTLDSYVIAPVKGAEPVTTAITGSEQFISDTIAWTDDKDNAVTGNFAADTVYKAKFTLTAKDGFTLTGVPADSFTHTSATSVTNTAGQGNIVITFKATEKEKYTLSGTVTSDGTKPVAGATVELLDDQGASLTSPVETTTGDDGAYTFTVEEGSYKIKVTAKDYVEYVSDTAITLDANKVDQDITLTPELDETAITPVSIESAFTSLLEIVDKSVTVKLPAITTDNKYGVIAYDADASGEDPNWSAGHLTYDKTRFNTQANGSGKVLAYIPFGIPVDLNGATVDKNGKVLTGKLKINDANGKVIDEVVYGETSGGIYVNNKRIVLNLPIAEVEAAKVGPDVASADATAKVTDWKVLTTGTPSKVKIVYDDGTYSEISVVYEITKAISEDEVTPILEEAPKAPKAPAPTEPTEPEEAPEVKVNGSAVLEGDLVEEGTEAIIAISLENAVFGEELKKENFVLEELPEGIEIKSIEKDTEDASKVVITLTGTLKEGDTLAKLTLTVDKSQFGTMAEEIFTKSVDDLVLDKISVQE